MKLTAIVDGDVVLHKLAYSVQKKGYFYKENDVLNGPFFLQKDLLQRFMLDRKELIKDVNFFEQIEVLDVDLDELLNNELYNIMGHVSRGTNVDVEFIFVRSPLNVKETNFRYKLPSLMKYKGSRGHKPMAYEALYNSEVWGQFDVREPGYGEADDLIAELWSESPELSVICSIDSDFKMLPCMYYNINNWDFCRVTPTEAIKNFWLKVYEGDPADNIPGLYQCVKIIHGEKKARALSRAGYKNMMKGFASDSDTLQIASRVIFAFLAQEISTEILGQTIDLIRFRKQNGEYVFDYS
ncbi:MAG TPA: hypothetical protein VIJ14_00115 [Rhabdochlamydiaceae bacterium]